MRGHADGVRRARPRYVQETDLACPWCAIGKAHLDQALLAFEHADEVSVLWRSFELDPGAPAVRDDTYSSQLAGRQRHWRKSMGCRTGSPPG
ncbi:MAG: DsbA family protein [Frankiales bacterium]|nr:DsbA family protein [Frankiales bacterium]